jgi:hypothetical protein
MNALQGEKYSDIHLVNVPCDVELISQLIQEGVTLTAKNSSQQVVYKINARAWGVLECSGVQFPPELLFFMRYKKDSRLYFSELKLIDISFDVFSQWPKDEEIKFSAMCLINANIPMEFLDSLLTYNCHTYGQLLISDCPTLSGIQLDEFEKKYPHFEIAIINPNTTHQPPLQHSVLTNKVADTEEDLLNALDAKTGEQSPNDIFPEARPCHFRRKRNNQPYPNYLREDVQYDGKNVIKTCKEPPFMKDVVTLYEEKYEDTPDYYLGEITAHIIKKTWYALPSLTPEDMLEAFYTSVKLELGYSEKTNLFYIRSAKSCEIEIAYIIRAKLAIRCNDEAIVDNYQAYFPCIQSIDFVNNTIGSAFKEQFLALQKAPLHFREELLIAFCRFDVGDLSDPSLKGRELLNLIIKERKGVCRHNVIAFVALKEFFNQNLPSNLKIKARPIRNAIHAFVEIKQNMRWQMICLGGAAMPEAINHKEKDFEFEKERLSKPSDLVIESNQELLSPETSSFNEKSSSTNSETPLMVYQKDADALIENKSQDGLTLHDESSLSSSVLGIKEQEKIKDFSYVLALNPFKASKALKTLPAANFSELAQQVIDLAKDLNPGENNLLLNFESSSQIEQFYAAMASKLTANNKRFLMIHPLNQFNPTEFVIDSETQKPVSQPRDLVKAAHAAKPGDFLLVNVSHYNEKSVSLLNALTDRKIRVLANQPLHDPITLLGVKLNQTEVGNDVYSRFLNAVYSVPSLAPQALFESFCKPINVTVPDEEMIVIDFYNGDAWKSQLQGGLDLNGQQLEFKKGALIHMLEAGKSSIRFYNPPMELEAFRVFLITLLHTRQFDANGVTYHLPEHFYYESATKTYDLACTEYPYVVEEPSSKKQDSFILNATTYHHFFNNIHCEEGIIGQKRGWLVT